MRKHIIFLCTIFTVLIAFTGCSSRAADTAAEQRLKEYQTEIEMLKQENAELNEFKDRLSFNLYKIEDTLYNLRNEGLLPFAGSQVNAPELLAAIKVIKSIKIDTEDDELVLSMMPLKWSGDFGTILMVYDVYKIGDSVTTMAGVFQKSDGEWKLVKFTREYKGDESFSIKGL